MNSFRGVYASNPGSGWLLHFGVSQFLLTRVMLMLSRNTRHDFDRYI
jgi:hypothetical protein